MNLTDLPLFSALTQKMSWISDRQKLLAENVANVDTPNYQATDLRPLDFSSTLSSVQQPLEMAPVASNAGHITLVSDQVQIPESQRIQTPEDKQINGNTVSMEDEMMKISDNSSDY